MTLNSNNSSGKSMNIRDIVTGYLKHWKWFIIAVALAFFLAMVYIRYATKEYAAAAKIEILEDKNATGELSVFQDLGALSGVKSNVDDEIQVLGSRSNFVTVVKKLRLNIKIESVGKIKSTQIYGVVKPFNVNFIVADSILNNSDFSFYVELNSDDKFGFSEEEGGASKTYSYGKNVKTKIGDIILTPNLVQLKKYKGNKYKISIKPLDNVAELYQRKVNISPAGEFSNIINLSVKDANKKKAKDVLDMLVRIYNENAINDRKILAQRTEKFINDRIADIYSNLSAADSSVVEFMSEKGIADISTQTNVNINSGAISQQGLESAYVELDIASAMEQVVNKQRGHSVVPSNIGDPSVRGTANQYNEMVQQRDRMLQSGFKANHPTVKNLNQQLGSLQSKLKSDLSALKNNLGSRVSSLSGQVARSSAHLYSTPQNEAALKKITRQRNNKEQLYNYLLTKREEAQIRFASATPKSRIVDFAYDKSPLPVSPNKPIILLASLILGAFIPFAIIYVKEMLDNKIHNKLGVEKLVDGLPVLAEIPKISLKESKLVQKNDRSVLAESLRILRTNLDYIVKSNSTIKKNNIIFITSSVSGEGKTFLASNLSLIFANTDKKVLLIGADIRNPKLYTFFNEDDTGEVGKKKSRKKQSGLTEYLSNNAVSLKDIILPATIENSKIDIIYSGKIPPNPSELLMKDKMKFLLKEVAVDYDYVIVDTAPLVVVTDTLLISQYADHVLYVTRAGMTEGKVLEYPIRLAKEGKLKGLNFVVNDVKESDLGYGGKYGYGYGKSDKKWWQFFRKK